MDYKVHVLLSAEVEISEIILYYSEINEMLPTRFLENLESTYEYLRHNPYFQKRYYDLRGIPVTNFPFILFFVVEEDRKIVKIFSCFHTSKDPKRIPKQHK